ncbi:hypothetical protein AB0D34_21425 [Streptomyces sp. NPDC048420]
MSASVGPSTHPSLYVRRRVGDPPTSGDDFDGRYDGLGELVTVLTVGRRR